MDRDVIINLRCFSDIDRHTALCLGEDGQPLFILIVMLLSHRLYSGHVCIDLSELCGNPLSDFFHEEDEDYQICTGLIFPDSKEISAVLRKHHSVGGEDDYSPVILDESGRLYFYKFRKFETSLTDNILERTSPALSSDEVMNIRSEFMALFPFEDNTIDMQALSAYLSLRSRFTVISGGPGTGKTFTVVKIISLLASAYSRKGRRISIALAAPTGKAAARLKESVKSSLSGLDIPEDIEALIPGETYTIHRLLKTRGRMTGFVHNEANTLPHDVVVIDESSMVDLALMTRLICALKKDSHLILLGDRDQLASVEGGAVFGDICDRGNEHGYTPGMAREISDFFGQTDSGIIPSDDSSNPMLGSLAVMHRSYRFGTGSGIGLLAESIKKGDSLRCVELLRDGQFPDIRIIEDGTESSAVSVIEQKADEFFTGPSSGTSAETMAGFIRSFSVLTAMRRGIRGAENMNTLVEKALASWDIIDPSERFYTGRPVMIRTNNYRLNLFNGDIGIIRNTDSEKNALFHDEGGDIRSIPLMRLPEHETAFAMTVHKSQGSEFDSIMLVLPRKWNRLLTRELLYTAVTRARKNVVIVADGELLKQMVITPVNRSTGLRERIWR